MNYTDMPYQIFPLGDAAATIDFGNLVDEKLNEEILARVKQLKEQSFPGIVEVLPAYSTLTVYYDIKTLKKKTPGNQTVFEWLRQQLEKKLQQPILQNEVAKRHIKIPVCYEDEFATDMQHLGTAKNITAEEVIQIHTSKSYKVYMLGFLPGFAYMGEVDQRINMPRKPQPERITAGSVGIAGKQTGIYPLASPGGWQIIGRTPLKLFDVAKEDPTLLKAGDTVQFYSITKTEFENIIATASLKQ
jgi:inhibitor of KinA